MPDHFRHCIMRFNPHEPRSEEKKKGLGQTNSWMESQRLISRRLSTCYWLIRNIGSYVQKRERRRTSKIRRKTFNESLWVIILSYIALVYFICFFFSNPKRIEMDRNLLVDFSLPIRLSSNLVLFLTGIFDSLELMQCRVHFWIVRDLSLENKYMIIKRKRGRRWQGVVAFYIDGTSKVARSGIRIIVFQKV